MKTLIGLLLLAAVPAQEKTAQDLLKGALSEAKDKNRRVLLTFGGAGCGWCTTFEAWKARPEVAPLLAKDLVNVYLDASKTAGTKELAAAYPRSQSSGIPWFVILDADGKELADSGEGRSNIGCPDTDGEIDAWIAILKKVRVALSDDDLEALKKSRTADREARKRK